MNLLLQHNLLPYLLIVVMGTGLWWQHNHIAKQDVVIGQQAESINQANTAMGLIQGYNEERFEKLEKVRKTDWKEGASFDIEI